MESTCDVVFSSPPVNVSVFLWISVNIQKIKRKTTAIELRFFRKLQTWASNYTKKASMIGILKLKFIYKLSLCFSSTLGGLR